MPAPAPFRPASSAGSRPPAAGPLSREEVDQALATLSPAYDRVATAMFGLDSHAGLAFLRGGGLTGTTEQVAEDVQALMAMLWAQFEALRQQLDQAKEQRAARSRPDDDELAQLTRLVRDPVVVLAADGTPVVDTGVAPARWLTLGELAQGLEHTAAELTDLLNEVDAAVSMMTSRLASLGDTLAKLQALADADETLPPLVAALDRAREQALADPLDRDGAHAAAVDQALTRLAADLDRAKQRLEEIARARDEYPQRLAWLREQVDQVATAEAEANQAYQVVRVKIANPGLPEVPDAAAGAWERLAELDQLANAGKWPELVDALADLERSAGEAVAYVDRLRNAASGLLDRRTELRGRLGAYRAKAARLGYGEHPGLSTAHRQAHDLLYTSPCDLPAATRAVFAYQQALADLTNAPVRDPKETVA